MIKKCISEQAMNDDFKGKKFLRRDTMALIERRGSAVRRSSVAATRDSSFSTSSSGRGSLAGQWYHYKH